MTLQLRGTPQPVQAVSASLDDAMIQKPVVQATEPAVLAATPKNDEDEE